VQLQRTDRQTLQHPEIATPGDQESVLHKETAAASGTSTGSCSTLLISEAMVRVPSYWLWLVYTHYTATIAARTSMMHVFHIPLPFSRFCFAVPVM